MHTGHSVTDSFKLSDTRLRKNLKQFNNKLLLYRLTTNVIRVVTLHLLSSLEN